MHVPHLHQAVILGLVFYAVTSVAVPVPWPADVVSKGVGIAKVDAEAQQGHAAKRRGIHDSIGDSIGDVLKRGGSAGRKTKGSGSNSGNGGKVNFDVKGNVEGGGVFGGFKQGDLGVGGGEKINKESANKALLKLSNEGSNKKNTKSSTSKKGVKKPN
ncbi:hypothetical protein ColLi_09230 [Colletotrichum liriopes]|uniref:Uncharacterized protein n=1 Tax=Colletotrichum liriopes TaxID=708192 RepID=A0AA37GSY7_9PEZI|nr:hypothetical protein ColLi_09230 [Colletotrichum liriopes]